MRNTTVFGPSADAEMVSVGRSARVARQGALVVAACWSLLACGTEAPVAQGVEEGDGPTCERDAVEAATDATALTLAESQSGFVCPIADQDWYAVSLGQPLVEVSLAMENVYSPVPVTYGLYAQGNLDQVVAAPPAQEVGIGKSFKALHCVEPGEYVVTVRSQDDTVEDARNPYTLSLTERPDPDSHESPGNDDSSAAVPLASGEDSSGYIACRGDEDWYAVDVPADALVQISFSMAAAELQPLVQLLGPDQQVIEERVHEAHEQAAELVFSRLLAESGRYWVRVADNDGADADAEVPFQLRVTVLDDADNHEPNDHPQDATPLSVETVSCGDEWHEYPLLQGSIAAAGDRDYFVLPLADCVGGVLEATLEITDPGVDLAASWALQQDVQASLTLIRPHVDSSCSDDLSCRVLAQSCDPDDPESWDCAGYFNACASEGRCAGATLCLPGNICGANQVQRSYMPLPMPNALVEPPPPNRAVLSAPLLGAAPVYLLVTDFRSDGGSPDARYTLSVRVRRDADPQDATATPNNLFGNLLNNDTFAVRENQPRASPIPVYEVGGCDSQPWVSGQLSYENDLDWFTYEHPCPEQDCTLQLRWEVDSGAVDHGLFVFPAGRENSWFNRELASGTSGALGGTSAMDSAADCFYASLTHGSNAYYLLVRDRVDDRRDWTDQQSYRLCLEKVADECVAPCRLVSTAEGAMECTAVP